MAPITKKPMASSAAKAGTGFGKTSSSIGKSSTMGGAGKSSINLGSSSKSSKYIGSSSGSGYSSKTASFLVSSGKNDSLLGSSGKSSKIVPANAKSQSYVSNTGKSSSSYDSSGKTGSFFGYTAKSENALGNGKSKASSIEKSSFATPSGKSSSILGSSEKHKPSAFSGKTSPDANREYPSFIRPQKEKSQTRIGIIWIPTRKRNKKKDMVYNPHNYDRYHEKGPSMFSYMSGDSPSYQQPHKKKEEETDLLVSERPKVATVAVNTGITAASIDLASDDGARDKPEEKQEFIKHDSEESKDAAGDNSERPNKNTSDYLENKDNNAKSQDNKWDKDKQGDNVDSVYLRPPPPHKTRSAASTNDDEDCGIKCLYYTLQCCDCVLM